VSFHCDLLLRARSDTTKAGAIPRAVAATQRRGHRRRTIEETFRLATIARCK
jgi:hypothetical protein